MSWSIGAVPPSEGEIIGGVFGRSETVSYHILFRVPETIGFTALRFDPLGVFEIQGFEGGIENMDTHVAKSSATKVQQFAPLAGVVDFTCIIVFGSRAQPEVPIQGFWYLRFFIVGFAVVAPGFKGPDIDFTDLSNETFFNVMTG